MNDKKFKLSASEAKPIACGFGSAIASDRIIVEGSLVGYMYRDAPDNKIDSGWRFFAGTETQEYADEPNNFAIYDINTIANYDPDIVLFLDANVGEAFERQGDNGPLERIKE